MSLIVRNSCKFVLQNTQKRKTRISFSDDVYRSLKYCSNLKVGPQAAASSSSSHSWIQSLYSKHIVSSPFLQPQQSQPDLYMNINASSNRQSTDANDANAFLKSFNDRYVSSTSNTHPACYNSFDNIISSSLKASNIYGVNNHNNIRTLVLNSSSVLSESSPDVLQCKKVDRDDSVLSCEGGDGTGKEQPPPTDNLMPSLSQLKEVELHIQLKLPKFFREPHQYSVYVADIEFHNNIAQKPYKSKGLLKYVWALTKLRMYAHFNYVRVEMNVLKTTLDEDLGIVQVRWQVMGVSQTMAVKIWKALKDKDELVLDGFSTLYVNKDGKIYKHVADNVMPDNERKRRRMGFVERLRERWRLRPVAGAPGFSTSSVKASLVKEKITT